MPNGPACAPPRRGLVFSGTVFPGTVAAVALLCMAGTARADCQSQLQLLSADMRDVILTEQQKQEIGGIVANARRHCWVHQEDVAMQYIARARNVAGIKPPPDEFDWENVPLESLEKESGRR